MKYVANAKAAQITYWKLFQSCRVTSLAVYITASHTESVIAEGLCVLWETTVCAVGSVKTFVTHVDVGSTNLLAFLVTSLAVMVSLLIPHILNILWLQPTDVPATFEIVILTVIPNRHYRSHVRLHFVTNLAVSGGLLMLQSFGAGRYTVDHLLKKKLWNRWSNSKLCLSLTLSVQSRQ